ncbi:MAG: DNA internalization-related competence protein ComEC/Rec2 [Firmicutes bacterium]|nr:DNA internalization-related competence protein ComEC/Rec2 [Bacillota bacterium]
MNKLKITLLSESGKFIHVGIVVLLFLLSLKEVLIIPFLFAELLFLCKKAKNIFVICLTVLFVMQLRIFLTEEVTFDDTKSSLEGKVVDVFQTKFVLLQGTKKYYVYSDNLVSVSPGDLVVIEGDFFENESQQIPHTFDYQTYLNTIGITASFYATDVFVTNHHFHINQIKTSISEYILLNFSQKTSPFLLLLVLGNSEYVSDEFNIATKELGITHLFALSGMHVGMIVAFLNQLLKRFYLQKKHHHFLIGVFLVIYNIITGFSVSIVRASLLIITLFWNEDKNLLFSRTDLLTFSFVLYLLFNPNYILLLGFQLSYLVACAILLGRIFFYKNSHLIQVLKITLLANLVSLPLLLETNKSFGVITIFANVFFIEFVSKMFLPLSFLTLFIVIFDPIYGYATSLFLKGIELFNFYNFQITFNFPNNAFKIMYYIIIFLLLKAYLNKKRTLIYGFYMIILIIVTVSLNTTIGITYVKVFDVGQGDAILVHQNNCNLLIDTGPIDDFDGIIEYLKGENISSIDILLITHNHEDHYGEVDDIIKSIDVKMIVAGTSIKNNENILVTLTKEGDTISCKGLEFQVLNSYQTNSLENNNSIVLYGKIGNDYWLFLGDAESKIEKELIDKYDLQVDILKVSHHGSSNATTESFLNAIQPKTAIISVGINNIYQHPSEEVLNRFKKREIFVLRTDQVGTITIFYGIIKNQTFFQTYKHQQFFWNQFPSILDSS